MIDFGSALATALPRTFLLEFEEGVRAAGRRAKEIMTDLAVGKRSRARVSGQIRTALVEQLLVQAAMASGFEAAEAGAVEGTSLYLYQAFARINRAIVVRATLSGPTSMPVVNKSRKRLVALINASYGRDLLRPEIVEDAGGPLAAFLVVSPDVTATDGIRCINVSMIDDRYEHYLFDEPFETFLARYAKPTKAAAEPLLVSRKVTSPYTPPEDGAADDHAGSGAKGPSA